MGATAAATRQILALREDLGAGRPARDLGWAIWAPTLLAPFLVMLGVALQPWIAPGDLLRDPLAVAETSEHCCKVYFGAVSNLGILVWAFAAAVALFAAAVLFADGRPAPEPLFLLSAALLTGLLMTDDLFLVHENVLPAFGVPEPVTYGAYGLAGLAYLVCSRREILKHRYGLLALGVVLLGVSVKIDWLFHSDHDLRILLEDGAKLAGISAWAAFHVNAAFRALAGPPARIRAAFARG